MTVNSEIKEEIQECIDFMEIDGCLLECPVLQRGHCGLQMSDDFDVYYKMMVSRSRVRETIKQQEIDRLNRVRDDKIRELWGIISNRDDSTMEDLNILEQLTKHSAVQGRLG